MDFLTYHRTDQYQRQKFVLAKKKQCCMNSINSNKVKLIYIFILNLPITFICFWILRFCTIGMKSEIELAQWSLINFYM
jgi:hypothetical protein